jgi:hypothetical protein
MNADNVRGLGVVCNNIGNIFYIKKEYENGIHYYEESLQYMKKEL